jgi:hypothetical protein
MSRLPFIRITRRRAVAGLAAALLLASLSTGFALTRPGAPDYRIASLRAMLFNSDQGTFSRDVLAEPRLEFWNVIIGEGGEGGPANSALVVVEVAGEPGSYEDARRLEFVARTARGELVRRTADLNVLNAQGRTYVGFWLYGVGCEPVRLQARLRGQAQAATRTDRIPFECGE